MKKLSGKTTVAMLLAFCLVALAGCGSSSTTPAPAGTGPASSSTPASSSRAQTLQYRIGTAATTGAYYPIGGMMASVLSKNMDGFNFTSESTGGSIENARRMNAGEIQVATFANDVVYFAYNGQDQFEAEGKQKIAGFLNLYNTPYQIVTMKRSGINSISDLAGKRVSVGSPGSGNNIKAQLFLNVFGFEDGKNISYQFLDWGEAANGLIDGNCDVAMIAVGLPAASIQELAASHEIQLISFTQEELDKLLATVPFFSADVVPAGTYTGIDYDVLTFGCGNTVGVSPDLDDDTVYKMAKVITENFTEFQSAHASLNAVSPEILGNTIIPLHPGAERYFKEVGLI